MKDRHGGYIECVRSRQQTMGNSQSLAVIIPSTICGLLFSSRSLFFHIFSCALLYTSETVKPWGYTWYTGIMACCVLATYVASRLRARQVRSQAPPRKRTFAKVSRLSSRHNASSNSLTSAGWRTTSVTGQSTCTVYYSANATPGKCACGPPEVRILQY